MIDGNKLGDVGFQKLGTPYSEMDCQKFVEWCLRQCGCNKDLAGSNAWYRFLLENGRVLTPEACTKELGCVPKGAFLFILEHDGGEEKRGYHDGLGNASHMGLCTMPRGKGSIQSSHSRGCVCEGVFKGKSISGGWNRVGLWPEVCYDYGGGSIPSVDPEPSPEPLPEKRMATVWAENGKPVNLRKTPSMLGKLIDRVPCGDQVEILDFDAKWCKVKWKNYTGYMMTKFLYTEDDMKLYTVTIPHVDKETAESLVNTFGGEMKEENG